MVVAWDAKSMNSLGYKSSVMGAPSHRHLPVSGCFPKHTAERRHQFSSVVSYSLWPRGLQHIRPPCPSPTPGVYSNSCPSSRWCYLTISSSVIRFSQCPQSFPASGSFPVSQLFAQVAKVWELQLEHQYSFLAMNIQGWFLLGLTGLISLLSKELSRVFSSTAVCKHQFFGTQPSLWSNT